MKKFKKLCACAALLVHGSQTKAIEPITTTIATVAAVSAVTGLWYNSSSFDTLAMQQAQDVLAKAPEYQNNLTSNRYDEAEIESIVTSLSKKRDQFNLPVYNELSRKVTQDIYALESSEDKFKRAFSWFRFSTSQEMKDAHSKVKAHLENAKKVSESLKTHKQFFVGHDIVQSYELMPESENQIVDWIKGSKKTDYVNNAYRDSLELDQLKAEKKSAYPKLLQRVNGLDIKIIQSVAVIMASKIAEKAQYDAAFVWTTDNIESTLESNLEKLKIKPGQKMEKGNLIDQLSFDAESLYKQKEILRSFAQWKNRRIAEEQTKATFCHENASGLFKLFLQHEKFLQGHQLVNFYKDLPEDEAGIKDWIFSRTKSHLYPILEFKEQADKDTQFIDNMLGSHDANLYPKTVSKLVERKTKLNNAVTLLYKAGLIQQEAQQRHDNKMQSEEAARKQLELKIEAERIGAETALRERQVAAQEDLAREAKKQTGIAAKNAETKAEQARIDAKNLRIKEEQNERNRVTARIQELKLQGLTDRQIYEQLKRERWSSSCLSIAFSLLYLATR